MLTQNEIKKKDSLITVIENINGSDAGITIHLIDDDNEAVVGAGIEVNGDARHYVTDLSGRVNIPQVKTLKHIHLIYVGVDENIIIKNNVANDITIIVNYKSLPRFHWARVPNLWLIKRNKIIPMGDSTFVKADALIKN